MSKNCTPQDYHYGRVVTCYCFQTSPAVSTICDLQKITATPKNLTCGEYAFTISINPYQHPQFDSNIHHLLAIFGTLYNACGGVIYLTRQGNDPVPKQKIDLFGTRFLQMVSHRTGISRDLFSFIEFTQTFDTERSWGSLVLLSRAAHQASIQVEFSLAIDGDIYPVEQTESQNTDTQTTLQQRINFNETSAAARHQGGLQSASSSQDAGYHGAKAIHKVNYSSYPTLNWAKNKYGWEKFVNVKEVNTSEILTSCSMLQPKSPMVVTPDRHQLQYMFQSASDMERVLATCETETNVGGFAIVCKSWRSIVSSSKTYQRPPGHICDILTVTEKGQVTFWTIVADVNEENINEAMEYLMITGRMVKYQLVRNSSQGLPTLFIQCGLIAPCVRTQMPIEVESAKMQQHLHHFSCEDPVSFKTLQRALSMVILSRETPLTRYAFDEAGVLLSARQAEVLMHRGKVNYIEGPPGCGKSWIAAELYKMHSGDKTVYICTTEPFLEFLRLNMVRGTLVQCDNDLITEINTGTFRNKTCVIIDDSHNFSCSNSAMKELFHLLKDNREMALFVFADNDCQSFDRERQQAMKKCIHDLTREVLEEEPVSLPLTEIYRSTRKVVSFIQSSAEDIRRTHYKIECANIDNGDDVECIAMVDVFLNTPKNELVKYIRYLLVSYQSSDIAIFMDQAHFSVETIINCKAMLGKQMPKITFQAAADPFPHAGIVVDTVDNFIGLDAPVCIFILPTTSQDMGSVRNLANPRYRVFLASRATHKAVFVVPKIDDRLVEHMKFDRFKVGDFVIIQTAFIRAVLLFEYQIDSIRFKNPCNSPRKGLHVIATTGHVH